MRSQAEDADRATAEIGAMTLLMEIFLMRLQIGAGE